MMHFGVLVFLNIFFIENVHLWKFIRKTKNDMKKDASRNFFGKEMREEIFRPLLI